MLMGIGRSLLYSIRHLVGLAIADSYPAFPVADDCQGGERKASPAFYNLGAAVDENNLFNH